MKAVLAAMPGRAERERPVGQGKGGDVTAALDEAAETAALKHFDREDVRIVSEEIGLRGEGRYRVVVDPIDGSQNAERGIPYFCLCVAVADGDTVGDVFFGYVYDFGANEEWMATRGEGALLNGKPILDGPRDHIEFMSLEATRAKLVQESLVDPRAAHRPRARDGRAGADVLPHGGRPHRRGRLPEAVALGRLRRRAADRPRARLRDRARRRARRSNDAPLDLTGALARRAPRRNAAS